jgi:transcriptional regulator of acetoin/glycerol metabolism
MRTPVAQRGTGSLAAIFACSAFVVAICAASYGRRLQNISAPRSGPSESVAKEAEAIRPLWQMEKAAIIAALEKLNGDKLMAATKLGIGKTTLYRKLKKYGIRMETTASRVTTT